MPTEVYEVRKETPPESKFANYNNYYDGYYHNYTIKIHFLYMEKLCESVKTGPLEKFTRFLFIRLNVAWVLTGVWMLVQDTTVLVEKA